MREKSYVPYDRSGEPPTGSSLITCKVYGKDMNQAIDRHNAAKKDNQMVGEAQLEEQGSQWVIVWKESIPRLADVIRPSFWNRRPKNKG